MTPDQRQFGADIAPASATPKYQQLAQQLARQANIAGFAVDGRLPDERALAGRYCVSRATVRGALDILEGKGLICRIRGKGTFLSRYPRNLHWFSASKTILLIQVRSSLRGLDAPGTYYGRIHAGVLEMARPLGLTVKQQRVRGYVHVPITEYTTPNPDEIGGVILCGTFDKEYIQMYLSEGIPVVVADYWAKDMAVDCVAIDLEAEADVAVRYLAEQGHTSLGFLAAARRESGTHYQGFDPDVSRLLGYLRQAAERWDIEMRDAWTILASPSTMLEPAIRLMLNSPSRPTAILCRTMAITHVLLRALRRASMHCPKDISVINRGSPIVYGRPVTSFVLQPEAIGQQAVRVLAERMQAYRQQVSKVLLTSQLVLGSTVGPAPDCMRSEPITRHSLPVGTVVPSDLSHCWKGVGTFRSR